MHLVSLNNAIGSGLIEEALEIVVTNIAPEDRQEFELMGAGRSMYETMLKAIKEPGAESWLIQHEDKIMAVGGWDGDSVWFATTNRVDSLSIREKAQFVKVLKDNRDYVLKKHGGPVGNVIWEGATRHRGFLKALGATFHDLWHVSEATGERFQFFSMGN